MGFFSRHSRFLDSSVVGNWPARLDARYEAIIGANKAAFDGARVLDLASHDGRWTFAAIEAGARSVVGIEVRPELVAAAEENMDAFGVPRGVYRFEAGDAFERRDVFLEGFDIVLCLGFFYHTSRHVELLRLIELTGARTVIVDTALLDSDGNLIQMKLEPAGHPAAGCDDTGVRDGKLLVAVPTAGALRLMLSHFGYSVEQYDWPSLIARLGLTPKEGPQSAENPVGDYSRGQRGTFLATIEN